MRRTYVIPLVLVCVVLWVGSSWSRSLEVDASQVAVIKPSAESTETRLLVQFTLPEILAGHSVDFASLSFGADCVGDEGMVSFQAYAITSAWDAKSVSWTGSWEKAGGDWDGRHSACEISEVGSGKELSFDVTDFANAWLREPSKNFGVLVKVSGAFSGTFSVDRVSAPKLRILY
ncbi:MAG: DNRLRE domain-containing protein [Candidatus Eisenbacteria bacterium]|nr:DNRLRE domain-containing protein [Candidatus Eisenbacteria bacterium]